MEAFVLSHTSLLYAVYMKTQGDRLWYEIIAGRANGVVGSVALVIYQPYRPRLALRSHQARSEELLAALKKAGIETLGETGISSNLSACKDYLAWLGNHDLSRMSRDVVQDDPHLLPFLQANLSGPAFAALAELCSLFPNGLQKQGRHQCEQKLRHASLQLAAGEAGRWMEG